MNANKESNYKRQKDYFRCFKWFVDKFMRMTLVVEWSTLDAKFRRFESHKGFCHIHSYLVQSKKGQQHVTLY
jgi:hypothetical protein